MYYTSGTTGFPKGVVLDYRVVANHAGAALEEFRFVNHDVWGHFAPMYHLVDAFGIFCATYVGATHVCMRDWDISRALELIQGEGVTITNMASTMMAMLLSSPKLPGTDISSLRMASCGGSPLPQGLIEQAFQGLGCEFFVSYGMTECCGKIAISLIKDAVAELPVAEQVAYCCTSGRPFICTDVRLVDDDGFSVPQGQPGEIVIRGDAVFSGYWNKPEATAKSFIDGWFATGDIGMVNDRGWISVVDRKKDMILVGGENVYSAEVERVLGSHPDVALAAVIGVPDPRPGGLLGEVVKAFIVPKAGRMLDPKAGKRSLTNYAKARLASYKLPVIVEWRTELPMTGSGKVQKVALKESQPPPFAAASTVVATAAAPTTDSPAAVSKRRRPDPTSFTAAPEDWLRDSLHRIEWDPATKRQQPKGKLAREAKWGLIDTYPTGQVGIDLLQRFRGSGILIDTLHSGSVLDGYANVVLLTPLGYDVAASDSAPGECVKEYQDWLKRLIQARATPHIWLFTRGVHVVPAAQMPHEPATAQAALWGFSRAFGRELPASQKLFLTDLCPSPRCDSSVLATQIWGRLDAGSDCGEEEVAVRAMVPYVARLRASQGLVSKVRSTPPIQCVPGASYVVTGGLGGLGLQLAIYLLSECACDHIVLLGRSANRANEKLAPILALAESFDAQVQSIFSNIWSIFSNIWSIFRRSGSGPPMRCIGGE